MISKYVQVKLLPDWVRHALAGLHYNRAEIGYHSAEEYYIGGSSGDGMRAFCCVATSAQGPSVQWGSFGGANMFNPTNRVDMDRDPVPLPKGTIVINGHVGGGKPTYATITIHPSDLDVIIPPARCTIHEDCVKNPEIGKACLAGGSGSSEEEQAALYAFSALKGGEYRQESLRRNKVRPETIEGLIAKGWLKRNKAGAMSITTAGRNARNGKNYW